MQNKIHNKTHTSIDNEPQCVSFSKRPLASPVKKSQIPKLKKRSSIPEDVPIISHSAITFPEEMALGQGGQGIVRRGIIDFASYAVKSVLKNKYDDKLTLQEIKISSKVRHDNIIRIMFLSETEREYHIVMELFPSHSLDDIIFKDDMKEKYMFDVAQRDNIAFQMSLAIAYLDNSSTSKPTIYHADIKPSNVLISNYMVDALYYVVKICDFGISSYINFDTLIQTTARQGGVGGTLPYMAP